MWEVPSTGPDIVILALWPDRSALPPRRFETNACFGRFGCEPRDITVNPRALLGIEARSAAHGADRPSADAPGCASLPTGN